MFDYKKKIINKFRVIDIVSLVVNFVFVGLFVYVSYLYSRKNVPTFTWLISVIGCSLGIMGLFYNRLKHKRKIVDAARQEAQYFTIERIIEDLKSGKIICIQRQEDIGFIKQEGMKLLFYTKNAEKLMERTYDNGILYIRTLFNSKSAFFYENGFLFSIRETEKNK